MSTKQVKVVTNESAPRIVADFWTVGEAEAYIDQLGQAGLAMLQLVESGFYSIDAPEDMVNGGELNQLRKQKELLANALRQVNERVFGKAILSFEDYAFIRRTCCNSLLQVGEFP